MCVYVVSVPEVGVGISPATNSEVISSCQYFNAMRESPLSTNVLLESSRSCSTTQHLSIEHRDNHKGTEWGRSQFTNNTRTSF